MFSYLGHQAASTRALLYYSRLVDETVPVAGIRINEIIIET